MKSVAVVFHSVCGNTMEMAKEYERAFIGEGHPVGIFRVRDESFREMCIKWPASHDHRKDIEAIPVLRDPGELEGYKVIVMGSPTYLGNVSAQMKAFMDSFYGHYEDNLFYGNYFLSFTSAQLPGNGASECLLAMNRFAMHMGMIPIPVPPDTGNMPEYGCLHFTGRKAMARMDMHVGVAIRRHVYSAAKVIWDELP